MTPDPLTPREDGLLPAAMRDSDTRGRRHAEKEHPYRNAFQRDRDRVIHSAHFRRLEYKTQVFVNGEGDNYRTRLTHTLEVTQIARSLARALHLNEDLAEAAALSHDLGHTPFGHAGERVLHELMAAAGGFNHNHQGLRIVEVLESRYADFDGLNLTYEVREGFFQHSKRTPIDGYDEFSSGDSPLLEIAVTLIADDIAYIAHDIDDGLYSELLHPELLQEQALWRDATRGDGFDSFRQGLKRPEGVRRLINLLVTDVINETRNNLVRMKINDFRAVRAEKKNLVKFSDEIEKKKSDLKTFLFRNFYRHPNVMRVMEEAQGMLRDLFAAYATGREKMPMEYGKIADIFGMERAAADYVSGMTDRFARESWQRLAGAGSSRESFCEKYKKDVDKREGGVII